MSDNNFAFPLMAADISHDGLTKRELFAAMAMQGLLSNPYISKMMDNVIDSKNPKTQDIRFEMATNATAMSAVDYADTLIRELNKND